MDWLTLNTREFCTNFEGLEWNVVFIITCWWIWKMCNDKVFNRGDLKVDFKFIRKQVHETARVYREGDSMNLQHKEILINWVPSLKGWLKLNTDQAAQRAFGIAGCGGIIRDHLGQWCGGFTAYIRVANALEAEAWGLYFGLSLAWNKGYGKVLVETNSKVLVDLLQHLPNAHPLYPIITSCNNLICCDWIVHIQHTYCQGNRAADCLAK